MASGIPKRAANVKKKEKRARNKAKNETLRKNRIADQEVRHAHNVKVGSTGKQRANVARKQVTALEQEDLLEL